MTTRPPTRTTTPPRTTLRATPGLLLAALACLAFPASAQEGRVTVKALTSELRDANYAADAAAVERLRDRFRALGEDPGFPDRGLAYYQAGFASNLLAALVGPGSVGNRQGDPAASLRHLEAGAEDLERAVALAPDFAAAHAALANNYGIRTAAQPDRAQELMAKSSAARQRSLELGPRDPRVVVGHAGFLFWAPPQAGGDATRGLARYREALELFAAEPAAERELHAWGEPDTWAFLAFAELSRERPDLAAARAALDRALALRPDFAWARGALLPRLEAAAAARQTAPAPAADPVNR